MRIPKGPCLIDIGPSLPSQVRAVGEHIKFLIKPQRHNVHRESLRLLLRKGEGESVIKFLRKIKNAVELKIFID